MAVMDFLPMTVTCRSSFGRHHHWTPEAALAVTFGPHQQSPFVVPFSSLSSSLKSSTFLREKHHYLNESITIFPSNDILFTQYLFLNKKKVTFSWRLESKRTRGKSNHKFRDALAENEETENFDGAEAVPNPEPQQILNADADPGNNLTIASCC